MMFRLQCEPTPTGTPRGDLVLMPAPLVAQLPDWAAALQSAGVSRVVSLLTDDDIAALNLSEEADVLAQRQLELVRYPIEDFQCPDGQDFRHFIAELCLGLDLGQTIAVHCRAGIGRTGLTAACVLKAQGMTSAAAQARVAKVRGRPIPETAEQIAFIAAFEPWASSPPVGPSPPVEPGREGS